MDFIVDLLRTRSNQDAIWVIIERLKNSAHFIPISKKYTFERLVKMYINEVVSKHGVLVTIVSDKDARFTLKFWQEFQIKKKRERKEINKNLELS